MKKLLAFLLTVSLLLSGSSIFVFAAAGLTYDLTCEGAVSEDGQNEIWNLKKGDVITVQFNMTASQDNAAIYTLQNQICYDSGFFELVSGSVSTLKTFKSAALKVDEHTSCVNMNTVNTATYGTAATTVGTLQLKVIASSGDSMIYQAHAKARDTSNQAMPITTCDLHVSIGAKVVPHFTVSFDVGGGDAVESQTAAKKTAVTLPTPTWKYHSFDYWTIDGVQYRAGASYTPTADVTAYAHWTEVAAPAAPTGLSTLKASTPTAKDGKIMGVTSAMEYKLSTAEDYTAVSGTEITGLAAGTYYVRVREAGNTPAGAYAAVTVGKWEVSAPTGLSAMQESKSGAKDGSISGVTTDMEYSTNENFSGAKTCPSGTLSGLTTGIYFVRYVADSSVNKPASPYAAVSVPLGTIPAAPTGLSSLQESKSGAKDGKIMGVTSAMEYSSNENFSGAKTCPDGTITGLAAGTYYVRYKAIAATNTAAGNPAAVQVDEGTVAAAPQGLSVLKTSTPTAKDGRISGVTAEMEYSTDAGFANAVSCPAGAITGLAAGTYYVRYKAVPAENKVAGAAAELIVPAGQIPAAPDNLIGVPTSRPGMKDGAISGTKDTMEYSAKADFSYVKPCENGRTGSLTAGTYYVRYKAVASTNTPASTAVAVTVEEGTPLIENNVLDADIKVQGTVATVSVNSEALALALKNDLDSDTLEIDLSAAAEKIDEAVLPKTMLSQISDALNSSASSLAYLTISYTDGSMSFDAEALKALVQQTSGSLTLSIRETKTDSLGAAQKNALQTLDVRGSFALNAYSGTTAISDFKGGTAEICVAFSAAYDTSNDGYGVSCVTAAGKLENADTVYDGRNLYFTVSHFSDYVVTYQEPSVFTDVSAGAYYADAVAWAVANGVTAGTTATTFSPNDYVKRGQVVTFLWRAAGCPETSTGSAFTDVSPNAYYAKAVAWAVANGITKGATDTTFNPDGICTRGQIVTFLARYTKGQAANKTNPFRDVQTGKFYYDAVLWAVEKGITQGTTATTFSPDAYCTRAQVVTFLWRCLAK